MTRRAVVSRVIRVQRRYAIRIRPIRSGGLINFGWIFELFIELYIICTHFSYIEYVLMIHLVNISLIFIKYEPSTVRSKSLAHGRFFLTHTWWKLCFFHEFEKPSWNLRNHGKHTPGPLEKTPVLRERSSHMTRRAVVSIVIRVQRRYAVRIRPIQ